MLSYKRTRRVVFVLIALSLAGLACGVGSLPGLGGGDKPPEGGVTDEGRTFVFTGLDVQKLDSYEAEFALDFEGERAGGVQVDITSAGSLQRQRDPKLLVVDSELSGEGFIQGMDLLSQMGDAAAVDVQVITAEDKLYVTASAAGESACRSLPTDIVDIGGLSDRLGLGAVQVEGLVDVKAGQEPVRLDLVGQETVNGVTADHYQALNAAIGSLTSGAIDLWYVPDQEYIARLTVDGEGSIPLYGSGAIDLTYDIVNTNQTVDAPIPGDCQEISLEDIDLENLNLDDLDLPPLPGE
jgi:hypothetical protein